MCPALIGGHLGGTGPADRCALGCGGGYVGVSSVRRPEWWGISGIEADIDVVVLQRSYAAPSEQHKARELGQRSAPCRWQRAGLANRSPLMSSGPPEDPR